MISRAGIEAEWADVPVTGAGHSAIERRREDSFTSDSFVQRDKKNNAIYENKIHFYFRFKSRIYLYLWLSLIEQND